MDYCFLARIPPLDPSRLNINLPFRLLTNSRDSINRELKSIVLISEFSYVIRILFLLAIFRAIV